MKYVIIIAIAVVLLIPLVLIGIIGMQESFAETDTKYKPPYQQIRDDGIHPVDVKCNEGKVLFFKFPDGSPVCIFDKSIKKLIFADRVFFGWSIKDNLVDWSYVQNKMNELEFENLTYVSVSNLDMVISPASAPLISLTQEFKSNSNSDVIFYTHHSTMSEKIMPDPYTKSVYPYPFHDPRFQDYNGLYDSAIIMSFNCKDTTLHVGPANPEIHVFYDIDKLTVTGYAKSKSISSNDVTNSNPNAYQFKFGSLYSTQFQSDDTLVIHDISEIQCVQDDLLFSSEYTIYYYYTVSFEIPNTIEVTK